MFTHAVNSVYDYDSKERRTATKTEPSFLRSLMTSFERYLKKSEKNFGFRIILDYYAGPLLWVPRNTVTGSVSLV